MQVSFLPILTSNHLFTCYFMSRLFSSAGKPLFDSTFSRNQLQSYLEVKKGGMLQQWVRRMCVLSGTRLLIYKDKFKRSQPSPFQLAKGFVEEVKMKGHDFCLKLTVTVGGERIIWLSFSDASEYNKWFRRCKKVSALKISFENELCWSLIKRFCPGD